MLEGGGVFSGPVKRSKVVGYSDNSVLFCNLICRTWMQLQQHAACARSEEFEQFNNGAQSKGHFITMSFARLHCSPWTLHKLERRCSPWLTTGLAGCVKPQKWSNVIQKKVTLTACKLGMLPDADNRAWQNRWPCTSGAQCHKHLVN